MSLKHIINSVKKFQVEMNDYSNFRFRNKGALHLKADQALFSSSLSRINISLLFHCTHTHKHRVRARLYTIFNTAADTWKKLPFTISYYDYMKLEKIELGDCPLQPYLSLLKLDF